MIAMTAMLIAGERVWSVYLRTAAADGRSRQGLRTRQQVHGQRHPYPPSRELLNNQLQTQIAV